MGKQFAKIEPQHRAFIERQKIFFVASAPPRGRVNVSPKGLSSLRVLGENEVAYLDCTRGRKVSSFNGFHVCRMMFLLVLVSCYD